MVKCIYGGNVIARDYLNKRILEANKMTYFQDVDKIKYEGRDSKNPFAFKHYNPGEVVLGKSMEEHMR